MLKEGNTAETKNTRRKNEELIITEAVPQKTRIQQLKYQNIGNVRAHPIHHSSQFTHYCRWNDKCDADLEYSLVEDPLVISACIQV